MHQLDKYLNCSIKVIECLTDRGEAEYSNLANQLYGNCLQLTAVREGEGFKEHENLLVYRLWLSKLKLQGDRIAERGLDKEKLEYVLNYVDKIHQKFLPEKLSCLMECFCQCRAYQVGAQTWKLFLTKVNETFLVINTIFGRPDESKELITLRMIAFAKGLELGEYGRQMLALQFYLVKAIAMSNDKTGTPDQVREVFVNQQDILTSTNASQEVLRLAEAIKTAILECHMANMVLWPTPVDTLCEDSPGRKSVVGKRYYLKTSKPDLETIKKKEAEQKLQQEYTEYQSSTRFDVDELIKNKQLVSQKHSFFKSVESNLIYKGYDQNRKSFLDDKAAAISLKKIKRAYGDKIMDGAEACFKSPSVTERAQSARNLRRPNFKQTEEKPGYKPGSNFYIAGSFKHGAEKHRQTRVHQMGSLRPVAAITQSFRGGLKRTPSRKLTRSGSGGNQTQVNLRDTGETEFILLDSTRENNSDRYYIG